jgi:hypothetical protein
MFQPGLSIADKQTRTEQTTPALPILRLFLNKGRDGPVLADSVNSQLSPEAVGRKMPLFSRVRFRRVWAIAAPGQEESFNLSQKTRSGFEMMQVAEEGKTMRSCWRPDCFAALYAAVEAGIDFLFFRKNPAGHA